MVKTGRDVEVVRAEDCGVVGNIQGRMPPDRTYLRLAGLLLLLSLPARFARINDNLWLDEAWVANSVLEPVLRDVFFTKAWTQSSPPLFLLLERWTIGLLGSSEAALRAIPVAAVLAGLALAALALRRWMSAPAALLGVALICSNYYVIKYCQQTKQYGTDFFVSALLVALVGRYLESGSRRDLAALLAAGAAGLFLSYTTVFWRGTLVLCASISMATGTSRFQWPRMACGGGVLGSVLLAVYIVFIRPNRTAELMKSLRSSYIDPLHPLISLERLISTIGTLVAALPGVFSGIAGIAATGLAAYVSLRAIADSRAGDPRGRMLALAGGLPLAGLLAAGTLGLYTVLDYPRMLLFTLPGIALLLGRGADLLLTRAMRGGEQKSGSGMAVFGVCAAVVVASRIVYIRAARPTEENRPAVWFVKSSLELRDLLYVHGGMYEQFKYYRTALDFHPEHLYIGNVQWPCCATGDRKEAASPSAKDLAGDLLEAARRARGHGVWLLFPAGSAGHWSTAFHGEIQSVPAILARGGCARN